MAENPDNGAHVGTILVPIDVSADHDRTALFTAAVTEARARNAQLHFLSVVPEAYLATSTDPTGTIKLAVEQTQVLLDKEIARYLPGDIPAASSVRYGPVSAVIIERASDLGADLIVIGARHSGIIAYALGSVASRVVNHATCSVYVVRS